MSWKKVGSEAKEGPKSPHPPSFVRLVVVPGAATVRGFVRALKPESLVKRFSTEQSRKSSFYEVFVSISYTLYQLYR